MDYNCSRCGRSFSCGETISFCPFCGQAYAGGATLQHSFSQRIVIGSDSERTVQEKYWKSTQAAISSALLRLQRELPRFQLEKAEEEITVPKQYELPPLHLRDFKALKNCTSVASFKMQLESYITRMEQSFRIHLALLELTDQGIKKNREAMVKRRLAYEMGEWSIDSLQDEYSIDVNREAEYINGFCKDVAEAVGSMMPDRLQPDFVFDPENVDWIKIMKEDEDWEGLPALTKEHEKLLKTVREILPSVYDAINQNSLLVLSSMQYDAGEDVEPELLNRRLLAQKGKDYDPIFGDPAEKLLEALADAVTYMTGLLNDLPDYAGVIELTSDWQLEKLKERLDSEKLDALYELIDNWSGKLTQELDKLYQSQTENMVDTYNAVVSIRQNLDCTEK